MPLALLQQQGEQQSTEQQQTQNFESSMRTINGGDEEEADTIHLNDYPPSSRDSSDREVELHGGVVGSSNGYSSLNHNAQSSMNDALKFVSSSFNDVVLLVQVTFENKENLLNLIRFLSFTTAGLILTVFIIIIVQGNPHSPPSSNINWGVPTHSPTAPPAAQVAYESVAYDALYDVPAGYISQVSGCWEVCYRAPFNRVYADPVSMMSTLSGQCSGDHLFVGSRNVEKDEFEIGAFGLKTTILQSSSLLVPSGLNAIYASNSGLNWYRVEDSAGNIGIGFSDYPASGSMQIPLTGVNDMALGTGCNNRLSLVFSSSQSSTNLGGSAKCLAFEAGDAVLGSQHEKIFYTNTCPVK